MKHAYFFMLVLTLCASATVSLANAAETVSPERFEPVKADVINANPSRYTIDVRTLVNWGVDQDAPYFAIYIQDDLPQQCGDFRQTDLSYTKPSNYRRQFDLSDAGHVLDAVERYGCIVVPNRPEG